MVELTTTVSSICRYSGNWLEATKAIPMAAPAWGNMANPTTFLGVYIRANATDPGTQNFTYYARDNVNAADETDGLNGCKIQRGTGQHKIMWQVTTIPALQSREKVARDAGQSWQSRHP